MNDLPEPRRGKDGLGYCPVCGEAREARLPPEAAAYLGRATRPRNCACLRRRLEDRERELERRRHDQAVERLRREAFPDRCMWDWTFENARPAPRLELGRRYVERWEQARRENRGLLLLGDVGTGKTYLAGCIANALLDREVSVRMTDFPRILSDLSGSFGGREAYLRRLCAPELLILDDLGVERSTDYAQEVVFQVIDTRYRTGKPLIVTTNLTPAQLRERSDTARARIYDRVTALCAAVPFTGPSFRRETARENLTETRRLVGEGQEGKREG